MNISSRQIKAKGIRFSAWEGGKEIGRAYLYIMRNDLHKRPFGLLEDVFVDEKYRSRAVGTKLLKMVLKEARKRKCYKLIAASRFSRRYVHRWYQKWGFEKHGYEFRRNFK